MSTSFRRRMVARALGGNTPRKTRYGNFRVRMVTHALTKGNESRTMINHSRASVEKTLAEVTEIMWRVSRDNLSVDARNLATLTHNELIDIAGADWVDDMSDETSALYAHVTTVYHHTAPYGAVADADMHAVAAQLSLPLSRLADTLAYVVAYGDTEVVA